MSEDDDSYSVLESEGVSFGYGYWVYSVGTLVLNAIVLMTVYSQAMKKLKFSFKKRSKREKKKDKTQSGLFPILGLSRADASIHWICFS